MEPRLIIRVVGLVVMSVVFYHFWAIWGAVMGLGLLMAFL